MQTSKKDVDAMATLLNNLSGKPKKQVVSESSSSKDIQVSDKQRDVDAMARILKGFNDATSNVAKKIKTTINESTRTDKGVDIGHFSVEKHDDAYNIRDNRTNDTLFEDIKLYETVCVIAKYLNEGKKINSNENVEVISANRRFEQSYYDALQHKNSYQSAKKSGNTARMDIAEARFSRAKHDAGTAKRRVKDLFEDATE